MPEGEVASESNPQLFVASSTTTDFTPLKMPQQQQQMLLQQQQQHQKFQHLIAAPIQPAHMLTPPGHVSQNSNSSFNTPVAPELNAARRLSSGGRKPKDADLVADCTVCKTIGTYQNSVM